MFNIDPNTPFKDAHRDPSALLLLEAAGAVTSIEIGPDGLTHGLSETLFSFLGWPEIKEESINIFDWIEAGSRSRFKDFVDMTLNQPEPHVFDVAFEGKIKKSFPKKNCFVLALPLNMNTEPFIQEIDSKLILSTRKTVPDALRLYLLPKKEKAVKKEGSLNFLSSGAAHDLNNLFQNTLSVTEMLQGKLNDPSLQRYVDLIRQSIDYAVDITDELLSPSDGEERTDAPIQCIREILSLLKRNLNSHITLTVDLPDDEKPLAIKTSHLAQIVLNLVINAKDALQESGNISVEGFYISDTEFALVIQDDGEGISQEIQEEIFEPFFTTKHEDEGTGLGLSIVKSVIEDAGGSISLISAPGEGAQFTVKLPLF